MKKGKVFTDQQKMSLMNLQKLTELYIQYRDMQYNLIEQYDKILEDPRYDELYLDLTPITKYRKYVEEDINGTVGYANTTTIIKELLQLQNQFEVASNNIPTTDPTTTAILQYKKNTEN